MVIYLGAPEISLIAVGSAITLVVLLFFIVFFSIKGKVKSLNKQAEELSLKLHDSLLERYELIKSLVEKKETLKKYEEEIKSLKVPTAVSTIAQKNEFYNSLMEINRFEKISPEAQAEIHSNDDLINNAINSYNEVANHFNEMIKNWPASSMALKYGYAKKEIFSKFSENA